METTEGNKLIAEFMGLVYNPYSSPLHQFGEGVVYDKSGKIIGAKKWHTVRYNESWDWLMPVVEKIESIEIEVGSYGVEIVNNECEIKHYGFDSVSYEEGETKIQATWKAIIEFIKWYNKQ